MSGFSHRTPACTAILRDGAIAEIPVHLKAWGVHKPALIAGSSVRQTAFYRQIHDALPPQALRDWPAVPAHSSAAWVQQAVAMAKQHGVDGFVSVGGGSAIDSAKACALLMAEGGALADHAIHFTPPDQLKAPVLMAPKLPILAVVVTASGSESTPSLGVSNDQGKKWLFSDPQLCPRLVLMDPVANLEVPAALMMSTGMNALAHAIEGLYSATRTPVTDALALEAIHRLPQALCHVHDHPEDVQGRSALLEAAHLAGLVIANARTCLHHAMCHAIGAYCGVSHGDANSVMLPHVMAYNRPAAEPELRRGAQAWGVKDDDWIAAIQDLQQRIGVPTRLRDLGVSRQDLPAVARKTMGERGLYFNPRRVKDEGEIMDLLSQAY